MTMRMENPEEDEMPGFGVHDDAEPGKPYEQQRKDWMDEVVRLLAETESGLGLNHAHYCHRLAYLLRTCEYPVWAAHAVRNYQLDRNVRLG